MHEILSVNISGAMTVDYRGESVTTGIYKNPVAGRVAVSGVNIAGDEQADRSVHGGPDRALYAYAVEDYAWWSAERGEEISPGTFGENVTTRGLDVSGALIGERWRVGNCELRVTSPRVPCYKLAMKMNDPAFIRTFARALRPGAYLAIVEEGDVAAGDRAEIVSRPTHGLTVAGMANIYLFERSRVAELLDAPELTESWRTWAHDQMK